MKTIPYPLPLSFIEARASFYIFFPTDTLSLNARPLLEGRSFLHKPDDSNYKKCRYADSRHLNAKPMNSGALKSVIKNLPQIKVLLRQYSGAIFRSGQSESASLPALWQLAYMGWSAPLFLSISSDPHSDSTVDDASADLSKFCHGVMTFLQTALFDKLSTHQHQEWTGLAIYEYANTQNLLIGINEVCSAPPSLIISTLDLMLEVPRTTVKPSASQSEDVARGLFEFSSARWTMERACIIYEAARYFTWIRKDNSGRVKQRHAFPYCLSIANAFQAGTPDFKNLFEPLFTRAFSDNNGVCLEEELIRLVDLSFLLQTKNMQDNSFSKHWKRFADQMLVITQLVNDRIVHARQYQKNRYVYTHADLKVFFGPSIFD